MVLGGEVLKNLQDDVLLAEALFGEDRVNEAWTLLKQITRHIEYIPDEGTTKGIREKIDEASHFHFRSASLSLRNSIALPPLRTRFAPALT
jgi:hypothetical protein